LLKKSNLQDFPFCLSPCPFRLRDGLATWAPDDPDFYRQRAALVAARGYVGATPAPVAEEASTA
jgi:hypothetical protein